MWIVIFHHLHCVTFIFTMTYSQIFKSVFLGLFVICRAFRFYSIARMSYWHIPCSIYTLTFVIIHTYFNMVDWHIVKLFLMVKLTHCWIDELTNYNRHRTEEITLKLITMTLLTINDYRHTSDSVTIKSKSKFIWNAKTV